MLKNAQKQSLNVYKYEYLVGMRMEIVKRASARPETPDIRPVSEETRQVTRLAKD